jgi:trypsin-like peptidase
MSRLIILATAAALIISSVATAAAPDDGVTRTAAWPFLFGPRQRPVYDSAPGDVTPHPAVARIIVPEEGAIAYGSGTLVGVKDNRGLVVTNWHVVRDSKGKVEVVFPDGFRSHAKPLKVDSDWDLAALVIWRPSAEPVKIATQPPRPGDLLTIHGYGRGKYRIATGHCTTYYAPRLDFPHEMVELDVEARQGDSGGPIFNQAGELAGVLFGAGQGTTLGSFSPRVRHFLASVAPDIDQARDRPLVAAASPPASNVSLPINNVSNEPASEYPSSPWSPPIKVIAGIHASNTNPKTQAASSGASSPTAQGQATPLTEFANRGSYEPFKSILAVVGIAAITMRLMKVVR